MIDIPDRIGINILSFIEDGIISASIPILADIKPLNGSIKIKVPKKAAKNPKNVPSRLFDLLNGKIVLPNFFPKIVAHPSPKVRTEMATYPIGLGKISKGIIIPMEKRTGAIA